MASSGTITGIFSGLDTTEIIDSIIKVERAPAYLMEAEQSLNTNIITTLKALQAKVYAVQAQARQLAYKASFQKTTVNVSDDTYLTATASGKAAIGSFDFRVLSVARNHQIASQGFSADDVTAFGTGTIQIAVGSSSPQTVTIDSNNNTLTGIKDAINNADMGVTAAILNDGSSENQYRLVITADKTGLLNKITISSDLSGGPDFNFDSASFDAPEALYMDSGSSSTISLGASAAYSGNENKNYTFTVQGTGSQTVGTDNVTLNWTDGTNSGSIIVTQADFEVELAGDGADGLKLSFSAGELNAGDTFQVQTFAPLLQQASNASIAYGSSSGTGSPITVVSQNNKFQNVVAGLTLTAKEETPAGQYVTVTTETDTSTIEDSIQALLDAYNDVNSYIDEQNKYDSETEEGGVLLGDSIVQTMQFSLRKLMSSTIRTESGEYQHLSSIGIRTDADGQLSIEDSSLLEEALTTNLDQVIALFTDSGYTSSNGIEYVSSTADTKEGAGYAVNITRAATQGNYTGTNITDPGSSSLVLDSTNNRLQIRVNGKLSNEIILSAKSYDSTDELVNELQQRIDADSRIGTLGLTVAWVENGTSGGHLELTSGSYGSKSTILVDSTTTSSALGALGLSNGVATTGLDVAGTINGEAAEGLGQYLTGADDSDTVAGLKLKISLTAGQISDGVEGEATLAKGMASKLNTLVSSLTATDNGLLSSRISSYETQNENLQERIDDFDTRLTSRRTRLEKQYQAMEEALAELSSTGDYISSWADTLKANWGNGSND
jgi:flagellar hook-associated protein 2